MENPFVRSNFLYRNTSANLFFDGNLTHISPHNNSTTEYFLSVDWYLLLCCLWPLVCRTSARSIRALFPCYFYQLALLQIQYTILAANPNPECSLILLHFLESFLSLIQFIILTIIEEQQINQHIPYIKYFYNPRTVILRCNLISHYMHLQ